MMVSTDEFDDMMFWERIIKRMQIRYTRYLYGDLTMPHLYD